MLRFNLQPEARDLLVQVLEEYSSELREEFSDTGSFEYRNKLKEKEKRIREILDTLHHPQQYMQPFLPFRYML